MASSVIFGNNGKVPWELRGRGEKDSLRHNEKVKEAIKKNLHELIAEESIIASDGTRRIRIPLRYLDQYRFKYGQPPRGVGQGPGNPGDHIGQGNMPGTGIPGEQPGDQAGELTFEVEVSLDDLARMMLEDLALPWLEEKLQHQEVVTGHHVGDRRRTGAISRLDKRQSMLANLKRRAIEKPGQPPKVGKFHKKDLRFRVVEEQKEKRASAAVYMLMDRSGSMTTEKRYIAKAFFFWVVRFLRIKYHKVDLVFIAHDAAAQIVEEKDFFAISNDGGTACSSAYKLALEHMIKLYASDATNIYLFHFSDGDNLPYDNKICVTLVKQLLLRCNMVGYGEIRMETNAQPSWVGMKPPGMGTLQEALRIILHPRLISVLVSRKEQIRYLLQRFLQPENPSILSA